ncbi:helix-turn-helix domain-containing protein [Thiorhodovibrio litoralis]|uniref:helix-turn-helix domain-containing protein n=1 Tax=Thiorhodovibrio litoralis TaxID=2952932 RepID=UPI002B25BD88|nr:helix-turn-helix domain-containing protein [Thiorhodovibrio litoralis]
MATQTPGTGPSVEGDQLIIPLDGSLALEDMDRTIIQTALERSDRNVTAAARMLGTTRETLRYRVRKYGLGGVERRRRDKVPAPIMRAGLCAVTICAEQ